MEVILPLVVPSLLLAVVVAATASPHSSRNLRLFFPTSPSSSSFVPPPYHSCLAAYRNSPKRESNKSLLTKLRYVRYGGIDEDDEEEVSTSRQKRLVVPILGPMPNQEPLLMGGEMTLNRPSPMQWAALQEAVVVHRNALAMEKSKASGAATFDGGTIDAAPLIAVIDKHSGPVSGQCGRYATLGAVVGISSNDCSNDQNQQRHDDEASFFETMTAPGLSGSDIIRPYSSSIRIVGVGRATLDSYFYRTPTKEITRGGYDTAASDEEINDSLACQDTEDWDEEDETEEIVPLVMAVFSPIIDRLLTDSTADRKTIGNKGAKSVHRSPVHAITELNNLSNKINWLHDDRRKLVYGITAAKARLHSREIMNSQDPTFVFDDTDGLGLASQTSVSSTAVEMNSDNAAIQDFLSQFSGDQLQVPDDPLKQLAKAEDQRNAVAFLESLPNFGLSFFGYYSPIPDLTSQMVELFVPYYSKEHRSKEEFEFEVLSFTALRTLEGYATPGDLAWGLQCCSTAERLQRVYDIMSLHKLQLEKTAHHLSQRLLDCGEECTDLF